MDRYRLDALPQTSRRRFLMTAATLSAAGFTLRRPFASWAVTPNTTHAPFLDPTAIHTIEVTADQDVYDAMIATYEQSQDKEWISVTIAINGESFEEAGLRLKGNSSLRGAGGGAMGGDFGGNNPGDQTTTPDATPVSNQTTTDDADDLGSSLGSREPQTLPWLIRLDKFVNDQNYQDITQIVIRSNNSESSLNEAVALNLLDKAGLASQQAAYVAFSFNGSDPVLRLGVEHPKDAWMEARFDKDGLLYKAESTGDYSYRGDDADSYLDVFELEAGGGDDADENIAPLTAFLVFINNAPDEDFEAGIADHLDLDQFAIYLAMMDLIQNTDDIDGPGNNSYLYVGPDSDQFTVVPWDMNLAFGGMGGFNRGDGTFQPGNMPGGDTTGGQTIPTNADGTPIDFGGQGIPTNPDGTPIATDDTQQPPTQNGGGTRPTGGQMPGGGGMGGGSNILVTRTTALSDFSTQVTDTTTELRASLLTSGVGQDILDTWVALLTDQAADLISADTVSQEASTISAFFTT